MSYPFRLSLLPLCLFGCIACLTQPIPQSEEEIGKIQDFPEAVLVYEKPPVRQERHFPLVLPRNEPLDGLVDAERVSGSRTGAMLPPLELPLPDIGDLLESEGLSETDSSTIPVADYPPEPAPRYWASQDKTYSLSSQFPEGLEPTQQRVLPRRKVRQDGWPLMELDPGLVVNSTETPAVSSGPTPSSKVENAAGSKEAESRRAPDDAALPFTATVPAAAGIEKPDVGGALPIQEDWRSIFARPGDEIEISFEEEGWVFVGYSGENASQAMAFQARRWLVGNTVFVFQALSLGEYELAFELQDNERGFQKRVVVDVQVVLEEELAESLKHPGAPPDGGSEQDYLFAESLARSGKYEEALEDLLSKYRANSAYLNDRIAELYWKLGQQESAVGYWSKNAESAEPDYSAKAVASIVTISIDAGDSNTLLKYLPTLMSPDRPDIADATLAAARYFVAKQVYEIAEELVGAYMQRYHVGIDEALFLAGRIYEENADARDFRRAKDYYLRVIEEHPESQFLEAARDRVRFINRHFIYIR
jgi:tetratricopeptide (TPR) repeat protein